MRFYELVDNIISNLAGLLLAYTYVVVYYIFVSLMSTNFLFNLKPQIYVKRNKSHLET